MKHSLDRDISTAMTKERENAIAIVRRKAKTIVGLPISTLLLAVTIWLLLWPVRGMTLLMPDKFLTTFLGEDRGVNSFVNKPSAQASVQVQRLATAMKIATRYHPLRNTCYAEAVIAHVFLSLRSIKHATIFGVRRDNADSKMEAHAWVLAGDTCVCGGHCSQDYTVVRCFVS